MLTQAQIDAQDQTAMSSVQVINLLLLVKRFPLYINNMGLFPDLETKLNEERDTPTVITQVLKAVLTQVGVLPPFVVESQGSEQEPAHFTTNENWYDLALDVLNCFYTVPGYLTRQSYALKTAIPDSEIMSMYRTNINRTL